MTDHTPDVQSAAPPPTDPWSIWFSRLVQVVGLGVVIFETVVEENDRPWLLLVATAMMLGGLGLQLVLRALLARGAP